MTKKKSETTKGPPIKELSKKSNAGRETKLNREMIAEIANYIELGFTIKDTCEAVGIEQSTFFNWKNQGKRDKENGIKSEFLEFLESIKKGKHKIKQLMLSKIVQAADENWNAAAWWLERKYPENYSLRPELRKTKTKNKGKQVESDVDEIINKLNEKFND